MFKRICTKLLILFGATLLPLAAMARDTISPAGKNTWDLYVYGNGPAISAILQAIKLMISPDSGGSSFQYLLLFLATAGFLAMAVKAGFDPAKNFVKMFFFIITVWMVTYLTRGAGSNVNVYDQASQYSNVVTGVPALVAIPASIISQAGYFLTQQIEQNFSLPGSVDEGTMGMSSGAEYNLFGKMISDADQYSISDPDLKRSVAAYIADCAVPAIAQAKLPLSDLMNSPNLVKTLGLATNQAIMTRYYMTESMNAATSGTGYNGPACAAGGLSATAQNTTSPGLGALVTCQQAYTCLSSDLPLLASALTSATAAQWQSTGVTTPFEGAMSSAIAMASAGGSSNAQAQYSSPEGFILQKAMISTSTGAFRQAATLTGNNEIMMATSLAQAEQSQKTSWATAAEIFKNMMGYVYTVLQAFIFAIVPIVVICLMIPGMGGAILVNYLQILVWLTLWTPMLAIVNFLVEIFGSSQLGTTIGSDGLTMNNSALVSEQASNLVLVAQFMGTLVPLMTWGLVKGAMAFTEFISHGIGSSFATQAGAQAATGNISMGNVGMDNVTMDKYSTARSVAVGNDAVQGLNSAGAANEKMDHGGATQWQRGQMLNAVSSESDMVSVKWGNGTQQSMTRADAKAKMASNSNVASEASEFGTSLSQSISAADKISTSDEIRSSMSDKEANSLSESEAKAVSSGQAYSAALGQQVTMGITLDVGAKGTASLEQLRRKAYEDKAAFDSQVQHVLDKSKSTGHGETKGSDLSTSHGSGSSGSHKFSTQAMHSLQDSVSRTESSAQSANKSIENAHTLSSGVSQSRVQEYRGESSLVGGDLRAGYESSAAAMDSTLAASKVDFAGGLASEGAAVGGISRHVSGGNSTLAGGAAAHGSGPGSQGPEGGALSVAAITTHITEGDANMKASFDQGQAFALKNIGDSSTGSGNFSVIYNGTDTAANKKFGPVEQPIPTRYDFNIGK